MSTTENTPESTQPDAAAPVNGAATGLEATVAQLQAQLAGANVAFLRA